jgi:hypothetical protein
MAANAAAEKNSTLSAGSTRCGSSLYTTKTAGTASTMLSTTRVPEELPKKSFCAAGEPAISIPHCLMAKQLFQLQQKQPIARADNVTFSRVSERRMKRKRV